MRLPKSAKTHQAPASSWSYDQHAASMARPLGQTSAGNDPLSMDERYHKEQMRSNQSSQQQKQQVFRLDEDASEVLTFTLTGSQKWGFRIRLLNDNRVIVSRLDKGPAEKAGLKVNDEILAVNNVPLSNKPRSLLLHDHPDQLQQLAVATNSNGQATDKSPGPGLGSASSDNKEPNKTIEQELPTANPYLSALTPSIELSKIDFAYQLIKHSSISNKLMLTIKRYLNPAYARASVAATNLQATEENREPDWPAAAKKPHSLAGVHYAYKCCECYCDNEGSTRNHSDGGGSSSSASSNESCCKAEVEMTEDEEEQEWDLDAEKIELVGRERFCGASMESGADQERGAAVAPKPVSANGRRPTQTAYVETSLDDLSYSSSASEKNDPNEEIDTTIRCPDTNKEISIKSSTNAGSRQSADEEVERRLLVQLQNQQREQQQEQQQQQLKRIAQQEQELHHHQQQQQQQQLQLRQDKYRKSQSEVADRGRPSQAGGVCFYGKDEQQTEDEPPEVPVRRSSQAAIPCQQSQLRRPQYSLVRPPPAMPSRQQQQQQRQQQTAVTPPLPPPPLKSAPGSGGFDASQLPRPLLLEEHKTLGRRPIRRMQPPLRTGPPSGGDLVRNKKPLPPPPPPGRSRSQPPRDIWSPSSSSVGSSGCSSSCEDSLNTMAKVGPRQSIASNGGLPRRSTPNDEMPSSPSPQSTVVECQRRHLSGASDTDIRKSTIGGEVLTPLSSTVAQHELTNNDELGEQEASECATKLVTAQQQTTEHLIEPNDLEQQQQHPKQDASLLQQQQDGIGTFTELANATVVAANVNGDARECSSEAQGDSGRLNSSVGQDDDFPAPPNSAIVVAANQSASTGATMAIDPDGLGNISTATTTNGWRSFSVSLQPPSQQLNKAAKQTRHSNLRSFSIATTTLAGRQQACSSQQWSESQHKAHEQQYPIKYWTLPSGLAAQQHQESLAGSSGRVFEEAGGRQATGGAADDLDGCKALGAVQQRPADCSYGAANRGFTGSLNVATNATTAASAAPVYNNKNIDHHIDEAIELNGRVRRSVAAAAATEPSASLGGKRPSADLDKMARDVRENIIVQKLDEQTYCLASERSRHYEMNTTAASQHPQQKQQHQHQSSRATGPIGGSGEQQNVHNNGLKDEWLRQMYKKMHKQTPERSLLQAVNSQPDTTQIKIKLKSPKSDHRFSPSYYSEEDFERRRDRSSVSPTFKPGSICNYLPGQSSISLHERNLHQVRQQSKSGPQSPVSSFNKLGPFEQQPLEAGELRYGKQKVGEHDRRCVFTQMLRDEATLKGENPLDGPFESCGPDDPRKQYVAVQQGHDIPLKGLRKPAPQPNVYKVGPAPPIIEPPGTQNGDIQRHYRDHLMKLNRLNRFEVAGQERPRASSLGREVADSWLDELYQDFDDVYQSMSSQKPTHTTEAGQSKRPPKVVLDKSYHQKLSHQTWSPGAAFETERLAKSLMDVEEALRQVSSGTVGGGSLSPLPPAICQVSPAGSSQSTNYGQMMGQRSTMDPQSPITSIGASSEQTRADSRNTNQSYQNGPALVEEMTLSDLEDEISSSLLASKESAGGKRRLGYLSAGEQLIKQGRNRNPLSSSLVSRYYLNTQGHSQLSGYQSDHSVGQPTEDQMFSDESINIHYRAPTSKLLKMNTFNEFELNRLKKFYSDELASRLQRSKSSRLNEADWGAQVAATAKSRSAHRAPQTKSAELLIPGVRQFITRTQPTVTGRESPFVDLHRYQRAFLTNKAGPQQGATGSAKRSRARFGRALFDFQAKGEGELSVRRGDLVELLELLEHSWARVEDCQSGLQGLVPLNYIDYSVGCAVARRDIQSGQQRYLSPTETISLLPMNKGEPITLIRRLSGHWYEASNTRQAMGFVWSNDLEIIKQPVIVATGASGRAGDAGHRATSSAHPEYSCAAPSGFSDDFSAEDDDDEFAPGYASEGDDEDEEEQEEEMYILDSGERVLARRRARSTSGLPERRAHHRQQWPAQEAARTRDGKCSQARACDQYEHERHQCCQMQTQQMDHPGQLPRRSSSSPYISSAGQPQHQVTDQQQVLGRMDQAGISERLPRLCRAKYAYKARQKDELDLQVGDILMVVHECDDGWLIGSSYATKQTGTFPGNFVEPI